MKTQPRQHISNKYNTCTKVTSPVYIGSKLLRNRINVVLFALCAKIGLCSLIQNLFYKTLGAASKIKKK